MESINRPIYRFFSFRTSERMASEYGHCSGQVNLQTGEILPISRMGCSITRRLIS